ncbi:MAG: thiamine/thiamine pyrophosphate ABC transporter permease ThiP [Pseudorhodobacter sp.]
MAGRAVSLIAAGLAVTILVLLLAPLGALGLRLGGFSLSPSDLAALRFTLWQAALSAGLSMVLAVPVARALARRRFRGREAMITLLGAPFLLPVIVAVLGLVTVFGRAGWVNQGLGFLGISAISIYGIPGVILAHVFFNLPLVVRIVLQGWQAIPAERFRLAASLGFSSRDIRRHIEIPMLRRVLPGAGLVVFTICLTSFAVALTLGGGPRATTVELAIYQALRLDFDLIAAARLALVQFGLCAMAFLLASRLALPTTFGAGLDVRGGPEGPPGLARWLDMLALILMTTFVALPLIAVVMRGLPGLAGLPVSVWAAATRSVLVALGSTALTVTAALVLALAWAKGGRSWLSLAASLPLAASALVLGTGFFLILQPLIRPSDLALPVTVLVNALLSLPFAFRILAPGVEALETDYARLAQSLAMGGYARLRWVILPRMARPLGFAAGLSAAFSMGDLGVITLFAAEQEPTLPLLVKQLMGSYRLETAASAALLLVGLSFALFWLFEDLGRRHAQS